MDEKEPKTPLGEVAEVVEPDLGDLSEKSLTTDPALISGIANLIDTTEILQTTDETDILNLIDKSASEEPTKDSTENLPEPSESVLPADKETSVLVPEEPTVPKHEETDEKISVETAVSIPEESTVLASDETTATACENAYSNNIDSDFISSPKQDPDIVKIEDEQTTEIFNTEKQKSDVDNVEKSEVSEENAIIENNIDHTSDTTDCVTDSLKCEPKTEDISTEKTSEDKLSDNSVSDDLSEHKLIDNSVNEIDNEPKEGEGVSDLIKSSKDGDSSIFANETNESEEIVQNGPEKSPENNDMDDDDKENKIEKMDIDESIVEDIDMSKDKHAENPLEETPNEASQTLDPFDELLGNDKHDSSEPQDSKKSVLEKNNETDDHGLNDDNNENDDPDNNDHDADDNNDVDDDHDMDVDNEHDPNIDNDALLDEDHAHVDDEILSDNINEADIAEGEGADEEICLLPDTEREITEADKLKALSAKKTSEITSESTNAFDSLLSDKEKTVTEETNTETTDELKDEFITDSTGAQVQTVEDDSELGDHAVEDDIEDQQDADKDKDDEEPEPEAEQTAEPSADVGIIREIKKTEQKCLLCDAEKPCIYRLLVENELKYLCGVDCLNNFQETNSNKYKIVYKKIVVSEINSKVKTCAQCEIEKLCFYQFPTDDSNENFICGGDCIKSFIGTDSEKYTVKRKLKYVHEVSTKSVECFWCTQKKDCYLETTYEGVKKFICSVQCLVSLQNVFPGVFRIKRKKTSVAKPSLLKLKVISNATDKYLDEGNKTVGKTQEEAQAARADRDRSFFRKCAQCQEPYIGNDKNLSWETMDFCNEKCLGKYQNTHGLHCANCKNTVSMVSLGKYCVRFGYDIRQFCCSGCLDEFKKGLKICCYCQRDISVGVDGFLAPVGDQGQFKDFCSQFCVEKFDQMSKHPIPPPIWAQCAVCSKEKPTTLEVSIDEKNPLRLCSEPCFAAFKFVNNVFPDQCRWCKKYFERKSAESYTIYTDAAAHCFCSKTCMNVYISNSRHIVPCNWCKVKKYNFDMIMRTLDDGQSLMMCSLNCLTLYQVSLNAVSSRRTKCDQCKRLLQAQYHLTMSDATVRNFCTYQCVMSFQRQYSKSPMILDGDSHTKQAVPTGAPRRTYAKGPVKSIAPKPLPKTTTTRSGMPVISNVQSLATSGSGAGGHTTRAKSKRLSLAQDKPPTPPPIEPPKPLTPPPPPPPKIYNHVIVKPAPPKEVRNMSTLTKPHMVTKGVSCRPHPCTKEVQTEDHLQKRILIPIPVPIYVPSPMAMYSLPFPVPVPIPLPIPIPVFIPTTRNSANGIMKEIKKIHDKMPTDPFEAELLMMAEMVAGEKKKCESDSESEEENGDAGGFSPDALDTANNTFGDDVLQMAFKMATEYSEPAVDLESAMTASTITPSSHPSMPTGLDENNPMHHHQIMMLEQQRAAAVAAAGVGRKRTRGSSSPVNATVNTRSSKRTRRQPETPTPHHAPEPPREPQEKPDANMCLKYTFGVNAWKQWVVTKNAEMEKSTVRRKPFKSEILQLTADELNYSLCLFVKEVRKPNGSEYAPDTIYYLVLGIQQYLFENGRIDNIFTDSYYEKFTECLDEVARKFSILYNDSQYIVTRVEEEHLWESKQLGAHSPHVLLSTLMFFNTKHFNLVTVEEHMQLSFSHIMKHWKRNPNQPGAAKIPGSRNVLLRFYPPQSALDANSRKKKVYEQQENEENPLRCPVKLYEFYLSKCPESVKTRNDVFYLMPERSCVPDSPVWYSTQALGREPLSKMLHRVKMVKEINIALLTS